MNNENTKAKKITYPKCGSLYENIFTLLFKF